MGISSSIRLLNHKRIDWMRYAKLHLATKLFGSFSKFIKQDQAEDILILRMDDKLGDGITATGFIREIKSAFPERNLIVVSGAATADIYLKLGYVDEVLVSKKGIMQTLDLFFKLKKRSYLYIVNTSHILNPRIVFLVSFLKAFKKISFGSYKSIFFSDHVKIDFLQEHVTERYRKALKLMQVESSQLIYEIKLPKDCDKRAFEYLKPWKSSGKKIVILNSFAGARLRNFNFETTSQIVKGLIKNPDIIVLSVANKGDHRILKKWITSDSAWIHNTDFSSILENMALLKHADLVVTPDTAWVHIASAFKKKLIAIYRQDSNPEELNSLIWSPYGTDYHIVFSQQNAQGLDDINTVNVDDVVKLALEDLGLK